MKKTGKWNRVLALMLGMLIIVGLLSSCQMGAPGVDGASIRKAEVDSEGRLVFTLTNGMSLSPVELPKAEQSVCEETNPLKGKKLSVNGDSICAGAGDAVGGYAKYVAENNEMILQNIARGGGTITAEQYTDDGKARHWISQTIENMDADADYIILEGGVNDAALGVPMGTITEGFNAQLDETTFCGAFESMLKQLTTRFVGKKIGYIFVHKMTANYRSDNPDDGTSYYHAAKKCCEKWGVPFLDLNVSVPAFAYFRWTDHEALEGMVTEYFYNGDGWHPNEAGYKTYYVPKIEAWLKTL